VTVQFQTTKTILIAAFILGVLLTWGLMNGDAHGRVNLLYLLILYVFFPIFSLALSISSILLGNGFNFAKFISLMPFWSNETKREFLILNQKTKLKWVLFYQSQLAAVSFSLASLCVFIVLLTSTDINFIWRSTILNAEQIYPLLDWLARPWFFWEGAQPDINLLKSTQDSRILALDRSGTNFGSWWQFILATQLFYALMLRVLSLTFSLFIIKKNELKISILTKKSQNTMNDSFHLAEVSHNITSDFSLINWCQFPESKISDILEIFEGKKISELKAGPLVSYSEQMVAERWQGKLLILVKGWEPPLAELADFMETGSGYLLPLDWNDQQVTALKKHHLNEWRRFVANLQDWQLVQPKLEKSDESEITLVKKNGVLE
jgi:hypothetical protein